MTTRFTVPMRYPTRAGKKARATSHGNEKVIAWGKWELSTTTLSAGSSLAG
ncbi:hypothetical protein NKH36_31140 [Mesorhizobium sp. M1312]|uniref:hypothetical protein n=1 Tax=unclassified Mesorhizobium TaxID=325217 RepID=UPI00333A4215